MMRPEIRLMLLVGVLGGFTTFSSYALETFNFVNDGQWARAAANILLNNPRRAGAGAAGLSAGAVRASELVD